MRLRASLPTALAAVLLLGLAGRADEPAADAGLDSLLSHFAASRGVQAEFREEKHLPLLREPLVSEGTLYYAPPGRMARFTRAPEESSLLLDGDRLRMEDGLGVEEIDLSSQPQAKRFVAQLLLLFQGDAKALRRDYEVTFEGDGDAWQLALVPRRLTMRAVIGEIVLRGNRETLVEMVLNGTQGESTRTTYADMRTDRPFDAGELSRLFPEDGAPRPLESPDAASR